MRARAIRLYELGQNNLKGFDLALPFHKVIVVTGLSGSGKSSLAIDTLYAEAQRRYVETFSAYVRQFLERMPRPNVRRIENIPPAIAIEQTNPVKNSRSTVGTLTEINHFVKMLFFSDSIPYCPDCGRPITPSSPQESANDLLRNASGCEAIITTRIEVKRDFHYLKQGLIQAGYFRVLVDGRVVNLEDLYEEQSLDVIIDRIRI